MNKEVKKEASLERVEQKESNLDMIAEKEKLEQQSLFALIDQKKLSEGTTYYKTTPDGRLVMEIANSRLNIYSNLHNKGDELIARFDPISETLANTTKDGYTRSFDEIDEEDAEASEKRL